MNIVLVLSITSTLIIHDAPMWQCHATTRFIALISLKIGCAVSWDIWTVNQDRWAVSQDIWTVNQDRWAVSQDIWAVNQDRWAVSQDIWAVYQDRWAVSQDIWAASVYWNVWPVPQDIWAVCQDISCLCPRMSDLCLWKSGRYARIYLVSVTGCLNSDSGDLGCFFGMPGLCLKISGKFLI